MAWEIVVQYKKTIEDLLDGSAEHLVILSKW